MGGSDGQELHVLAVRTGAVLHRIPNPDQRIGQVFLAPRGDRAAALRFAESPTDSPVLEIRNLPDWNLQTALVLGPELPPLRHIVTALPRGDDGRPNFWLSFVAFSETSDHLALGFFTGHEVPQAFVTMYDLQAGRWADWAALLGGSTYLWLFPDAERLVVVSRTPLLQWTGTLGTVVALDADTGERLAEQQISPVSTAIRSLRGAEHMGTTASLIGAFASGSTLALVTDDLARIALDRASLSVTRVDPPLFDQLLATTVTPVGERLVTRTPVDELVVVDLRDWTRVSLHQLPARPADHPWLLVGADPTAEVVYLADTGQRCLYHWNPTTATLSAPLACDLYLEDPWIVFYGWPAFAPGTTATHAPLAATLLDPARLATAALAATFALASVGKLLTLRSFHRTLARTLPRLGRAAPLATGTVLTLEALPALLLLPPAPLSPGLLLAASVLVLFTAGTRYT
ncbi:MAG: hypothetical protein N2Z82_03245, partial [Thermomicrobium sp.]|nr:hypothetical protein [Thermomicrobium sp.]